MTKLEFVTKALEIAEAQGNEEMVEFAQAWLDKDAADKEKAKAKRAEKAAEMDGIEADFADYILGICGTEPITRATILEELVAAGHDTFGEKEMTAARVTRIANKLVEAGKLVKEEIKAGKGKQAAYALA